VVFALLMACNFFVANAVGLTGGLFGFWLGVQWEKRYLQFAYPRTLIPTLLLGIVGFVGLFFFCMGVKLDHTLPYYAVLTAIQYGALGLWISYGAPALCLRKSISR